MSAAVTASQAFALAVLLGVLSPPAARAEGAAPPPPSKPAQAALSAGFERCRHADIDACYDALRWNPSDPALLEALGDALTRQNRPADALRTYRRAASLAPRDPSIAAKISAIESKSSAKRAPVRTANEKRYSNAAPESQSH
jgi:cytochrome c-type biogenesis protein CcmH/NrfG